MDADGSSQKQLTVEGGNEGSVCPDGRTVVYRSRRSGGLGIWKIDIDGSNAKLLVTHSGETSPQCSPDGKWVVYTSLGAGKWPALWKASIATDHRVLLNNKFSHRPAISPDGRWIACFYREEQASQPDPAKPDSVAIIPFEGGQPKRVFQIPQTVFEPAGVRWTSDGRAFTYVDNRGGISNIWSQPLVGGIPKQVTDFKGDRIFDFDWSPDGTQLLFSRGTRASDVILIRDLK